MFKYWHDGQRLFTVAAVSGWHICPLSSDCKETYSVENMVMFIARGVSLVDGHPPPSKKPPV